MYGQCRPRHDDRPGRKVHADNPTDFRLVFPRIGANGYRWAFSGYVTGFETSAPVAGIFGASVTIKITGAPALEAVTP